jgi:2-oxoglutarate ferredoxin oxidoreductase subunit alpha
VKWGSHGDYEVIAYAPNSVQEMFDLTIKAFNMAERYRTPTFVMSDQVVAHMTSKVVIPPPDQIEIVNRDRAAKPSSGFIPFPYDDDFPPMAVAGDGFHVNVDSLTHDERGYPSLDNSVSEKMLDHITGKILNHVEEIVETEEYRTDDAEVVIIAYGSTSRSALRVVKEARQKEKRVGLLRLITPWPFPTKKIEALGDRVQAIVVPEINYGQMEHVVREFASCPVIGVHHPAGALIPPQKINLALEKL